MSRILPDFSQIVFVPCANRPRPIHPEEKTDLSKLFDAVLNNKPLEVDEKQLKKMIAKDLTIDVNKIDERLMGILREAMVYYMTVWPGWHRSDEYNSGKLQLKDWFARFRQYLIFKCNFIIKNAGNFAAELSNETVRKDVAIQTQANPANKNIAPYTLCIGGPPYVVNNIVFEESNGDILIRQQEGQPWCTLKLKQFLNWPDVSVNVILPDISFTRTNTHKFERYITCNELAVLPEENHIKHIKKTADVREHELVPYSYEFITCYLQHFYQTIKQFPGVNASRMQELKAIFTEFLYDINEVNVYNCTMCTNTSIGYNIGKCKYIRKNSVEKKTADQNTVNYYEILTPQVDFSLHYFKAVQEPLLNGRISFESINKLSLGKDSKVVTENVNNSCIVYNCNLCSAMYTGPYAYYNVSQHFSTKHKALKAVKCCKCHKEFDIKLLTAGRWGHTCI